MRPLDSATTFDFTPYTVPIYDRVLVRLKAADLDQEVKERAISCMGFIVSHLGDHLAGSEGLSCIHLKDSIDQLRCHLRSTDGVLAHILGSFTKRDH